MPGSTGYAIIRAMTTSLLPAIVQEPAGIAAASVIWLHGLGASGHDFAPIPPELGLPADPAVRFIFPHAPQIPVTLNNNMVMPAWYDIASLEARGQDEQGIRESGRRLTQLIEHENGRGVPTDKIVLAGFSQGGAIALHVGLRHPERLAGVMVLSSALTLADTLPAEASAANRQTPLFIAHGTHDPMIGIDVGRKTKGFLEAQGYGVEWHEYAMEHNVCLEEIADIGSWLNGVLQAG